LRAAALVLTLTLTLMVLFAAQAASQVEIDAEIEVVRVVDGDTIVAVVTKVYNDRYRDLEGEEIRIRLADINAPEKDTPEGEEATQRLKEILAEAEKYYIDIDDVYVTDKYGRIVAVLYIKIGDKLVNVNAKLVAEGYAEIWDHENEFNPETWTTTETAIQEAQLAQQDQDNTTPITEDLIAALAIALLLVLAAATRKALGK